MNNSIFWVLEVTIQPGELDKFKALMNEMVDSTWANEPMALNYEWFVSADHTSCHLYERYADSAAVLVHLTRFGQQFAARFLAVAKPTRLVVYGHPSAEATRALSELGALFVTALGGFTRDR
ncbi:MAG TPA: antibiotic biosynthesis monooxygenase [Caldilineaceae bacterium]|nr:antibiotic biosynthesis monooxygenase [Caldilineaceae bacterium]